MIGKVTRGSNVGGLLRYLFGPGRHNEHTHQHIVAGWSPHAADMVQLTAAGGFDLRELTEELREPVELAGKSPDRTVWHCSVRAAPEDPVLTDDQWAEVAHDVMARTGLDTPGRHGVRWVAVRHAPDHVHVVATLAREDGSNASPRNDFYRVAEACHAAEARYGLRSTAPADRTAGRQATRAEVEKAVRAGQPEPARATLRREVRAAAASTTTQAGFLADLQERGVMVRLRHSTQDPEQITGYAVAWPEDRVGGSPPAFFGGSKLAPELSWGRLSPRWTTVGESPPDRGDGWSGIVEHLDKLDPTVEGGDETLGSVAAAMLDRLPGRDSDPTRRQLNDDLARACRRAWGASRTVQRGHARALRAAARLARPARQDKEAEEAVKRLVKLLGVLAEQRSAQQRLAQAQAAVRAAATLQQLHAPATGGPVTSAIARPVTARSVGLPAATPRRPRA